MICSVIHKEWQRNLFEAWSSDFLLFPVPLELLDYLVTPTPSPRTHTVISEYLKQKEMISALNDQAGKGIIQFPETSASLIRLWLPSSAGQSIPGTMAQQGFHYKNVFTEGLKAEIFWEVSPISHRHACQAQKNPKQESPSQSSPGRESFRAANPHRPQQLKVSIPLDSDMST